MNELTVSLGGADRLKRIQQVSQFVRVFLFCCMAFVIWFGARALAGEVSRGFGGAGLDGVNLMAVVGCLGASAHIIALLAWYWLLARLFGFYSKGTIFGREPIGCIKWAGVACILGSLIQAAYYIGWGRHWHSPAEVVGRVVGQNAPVLTSIHVYRMSFFSFDFGTGVDAGPVIAGIVVVMIAWIMDEGRKMRDEQALTV